MLRSYVALPLLSLVSSALLAGSHDMQQHISSELVTFKSVAHCEPTDRFDRILTNHMHRGLARVFVDGTWHGLHLTKIEEQYVSDDPPGLYLYFSDDLGTARKKLNSMGWKIPDKGLRIADDGVYTLTVTLRKQKIGARLDCDLV